MVAHRRGVDDEPDALVAVEAGQRGQRPALELDDRDAQARGMEDQSLERLASLRHDEQAAGLAPRGERLLHGSPSGDQLLVLADEVRRRQRRGRLERPVGTRPWRHGPDRAGGRRGRTARDARVHAVGRSRPDDRGPADAPRSYGRSPIGSVAAGRRRGTAGRRHGTDDRGTGRRRRGPAVDGRGDPDPGPVAGAAMLGGRRSAGGPDAVADRRRRGVAGPSWRGRRAGRRGAAAPSWPRADRRRRAYPRRADRSAGAVRPPAAGRGRTGSPGGPDRGGPDRGGPEPAADRSAADRRGSPRPPLGRGRRSGSSLRRGRSATAHRLGRRQRWPSRVSSTAIPRAASSSRSRSEAAQSRRRPRGGPGLEQRRDLGVERVLVGQDAEHLVEVAQARRDGRRHRRSRSTAPRSADSTRGRGRTPPPARPRC